MKHRRVETKIDLGDVWRSIRGKLLTGYKRREERKERENDALGNVVFIGGKVD